MSSYGIAIIIIIIVMTAVYTLSTSNKHIFAQSCSGSSGFACGPFSLNSLGVLNITLQQATGGDITIYGLACSSTISNTASNSLPGYGNAYVTNSIAYYPAGGSPGTGAVVYTGSGRQFLLYCFSASQEASKANSSGGDFIGYLWANFSISGRPGRITQLVATVEARYT